MVLFFLERSFQSGDGGEESNQGFVFRNDRRWTTPHQSVASYVAQHRQLLFVDDVRVADERFPDGSPCLQVIPSWPPIDFR